MAFQLVNQPLHMSLDVCNLMFSLGLRCSGPGFSTFGLKYLSLQLSVFGHQVQSAILQVRMAGSVSRLSLNTSNSS